MKYKDESEDMNIKTGWTKWILPIRKGYKMSCCDCGLVHNLNFRVKDGRAEFQVQRNNRATGQVRRWNKINVKHTY